MLVLTRRACLPLFRQETTVSVRVPVNDPVQYPGIYEIIRGNTRLYVRIPDGAPGAYRGEILFPVTFRNRVSSWRDEHMMTAPGTNPDDRFGERRNQHIGHPDAYPDRYVRHIQNLPVVVP